MPKVSHRSSIFISYCRTESSEFVKRLAKDLCYILDDDNAVWYDTMMTADKDWLVEITRQLSLRKVFILIVSPDALRRPYVRQEIQLAWMGKNKTTSAKKIPIILHFRECRNEIPKGYEFLTTPQWIQCFPPMTYRSVLNEIIKALHISLDTKASDFLHTLDELNLTDLVRPKVSAGYSLEESEEELKGLENYIYLCVRQNLWDDVLICANEALSIAPHKRHIQDIKQQAIEKLRCTHLEHQRDNAFHSSIPNAQNEGGNTQTSRINISNMKSPTNPKVSRSTSHITQRTSSKRDKSQPNRPFISSKNIPHSKSSIYTSNLENSSTIDTIEFSQSPNLKKMPPSQGWIRKNGPIYLNNFADFVSRIIREDNRFLLALCLSDIFIIPLILSFRLQLFFLLVFLTSLAISFLAFIIGPITKDLRMTAISVLVFGASWTLMGLLLGWLIGEIISQVINSSLIIASKSTLHLNYNMFAVVFASICLLGSLCLHLAVIFKTDYVTNVTNADTTQNRKTRQKRRKR